MEKIGDEGSFLLSLCTYDIFFCPVSGTKIREWRLKKHEKHSFAAFFEDQHSNDRLLKYLHFFVFGDICKQNERKYH
ncbi:MAG: hypothetical protein HFH03_12325 [Dorea sp.]|nr:hypothetical protein [Dorea sp.]